ncbi:MAG: metal-dependent transcriptional regulator [Verrucomicrobia bacterium]|nr:metal-dependent transcriptional regulator [Verrucomicrobiota bacterium]
MSNSVWKEYEANPLTHSAAHYLMAINSLLDERGYARVTDVARELNITRGSCSISLKPLKQRGLVTVDDNKFLQLSEEGKRLAGLVEQNDKVLESLFVDILGVEQEQAEIDACKIEHLLSLETSMNLSAFVKFMTSKRKVSADLLTAFRKLSPTCQKDASQCDICDTTCLVSVEE